jgi:hypothetical protein
LVGLYLRLYSAVLCQCLLQATKRFPAVDLFIGRVSSVHEKILIGGSSMKKKRFGNIGLHCDHPHIQIFFSDVLLIYLP